MLHRWWKENFFACYVFVSVSSLWFLRNERFLQEDRAVRCITNIFFGIGGFSVEIVWIVPWVFSKWAICWGALSMTVNIQPLSSNPFSSTSSLQASPQGDTFPEKRWYESINSSRGIHETISACEKHGKKEVSDQKERRARVCRNAMDGWLSGRTSPDRVQRKTEAICGSHPR